MLQAEHAPSPRRGAEPPPLPRRSPEKKKPYNEAVSGEQLRKSPTKPPATSETAQRYIPRPDLPSSLNELLREFQGVEDHLFTIHDQQSHEYKEVQLKLDAMRGAILDVIREHEASEDAPPPSPPPAPPTAPVRGLFGGVAHRLNALKDRAVVSVRHFFSRKQAEAPAKKPLPSESTESPYGSLESYSSALNEALVEVRDLPTILLTQRSLDGKILTRSEKEKLIKRFHEHTKELFDEDAVPDELISPTPEFQPTAEALLKNVGRITEEAIPISYLARTEDLVASTKPETDPLLKLELLSIKRDMSTFVEGLKKTAENSSLSAKDRDKALAKLKRLSYYLGGSAETFPTRLTTILQAMEAIPALDMPTIPKNNLFEMYRKRIHEIHKTFPPGSQTRDAIERSFMKIDAQLRPPVQEAA
jgi:hypothetical protein